MFEKISLANDHIGIDAFTEQAYLNYAMYVILDRALPHLADGLKPVQRRIIYAMSELGLKSTAKPKKSARTVGDVLGKFHPHGDTACYEAMVLMAQSFSYRYPLIDGQGNWGAADDPKSFAAMRYTESRLSAYAEVLLAELLQGATAWTDNFDASLQEPQTLPAQLPNLLLNGSAGIAVGMATDIPAHNLREVVEACLLLLKKPKASIAEIRQVLPAPDLPTGAQIISSEEDLHSMYASGHGQFRARARYHISKQGIVVYELPQHCSSTRIVEQIAKQIQSKKLTWLEDIRDESDHQQATRLVLIPRSNRVDVELLMSHLFATTDLERSYRVNLNMIGLNGLPQVKNLASFLLEWLEFRKQAVRLRLETRLQKIEDRLEILAGLLIAYVNLEQVIEIIRHADDPKQQLQQTFELTQRQAEAILEIRLRQLARLEQLRIQQEQSTLNRQAKEIQAILNSATKLRNLIRRELKEIAFKHGDDRRSLLQVAERAQALSVDQLIPAETVSVVLSKLGWIRVAKNEVDGTSLNYRGNDGCHLQVIGKNNNSLVLIDNRGKSYTLNVRQLPNARGHGDPVSSHINIADKTKFNNMLLAQADEQYLLVSSDGYGFVVSFNELTCRSRSGKNSVNLSAGSSLLPAIKVNPSDQFVVSVSNAGYLLMFPLNQVVRLNRGRGHKLMGIKPKLQEKLVHCLLLGDNQDLVITSGKRSMTVRWRELKQIISQRAKRGKQLPRGFAKVSALEVISKD